MAIRNVIVALAVLSASAQAGAEGPPPAQGPCASRFQSAFAQIGKAAQRTADSTAATRAYNEVTGYFGQRAEVCEPGAYQVFMDGFLEQARTAIRGSAKDKNAQIYLLIAAVTQVPSRVPADDGRGAVASFHQTKAEIAAVADDVKSTPQIKQLISSFERSGPPSVDPAAGGPPPFDPGAVAVRGTAPVAQVGTVVVPGGPVTTQAPTPAPPGMVNVPVSQAAAPAGNGHGGPPPVTVQPVRVPQVPLPPWAVVHVYEAREALRARDVAGAQSKLDAIVRWMESNP